MEKTLYPKTKRFGDSKTIITEKLDGSNLGLFKLNGELIIAQRNHVYKFGELNKNNSYKGLIGWLNDNLEKIDLQEGSGVFGEWIGMGKIKYEEDLDKRFYIFAKANIDEKLDVRNIIYNKDLFIYPFISQSIPEFMGIVPNIDYDGPIDIDNLNTLYNEYCEKVGRQVEGFIINKNNNILKYVRYKNGVLTNHKE